MRMHHVAAMAIDGKYVNGLDTHDTSLAQLAMHTMVLVVEAVRSSSCRLSSQTWSYCSAGSQPPLQLVGVQLPRA